VAVCPNSTEVHIYNRTATGWVKGQSLTEHDKLVTGVDWAPNSNRIVTCSQDRNAYVWTYDAGSKLWKPTLVILRINRGATHVKWSPQENKFAVASGARIISVCYFEEDNNWWVCKHIKKPIRSTVLAIDWHPNNVLIAAGSADFKARVFSAAIKGVDKKPEPNAWFAKMGAFGECLAEFASPHFGWVHGIAFSPEGDALAWVSHDSTVSVVSGGASGQVVHVRYPGLPFRALLWLTPNSIVAGGHDNAPILFTNASGTWAHVRSLDATESAAAETKAVGTARSIFGNMDSKGQAQSNDTKLKTLHQNAISYLGLSSGSRLEVTKFVTAGLDGKVITWDVRALETQIAGLKIA
jgi:actin related protein 2/3 complex, subunit 1A/1B